MDKQEEKDKTDKEIHMMATSLAELEEEEETYKMTKEVEDLIYKYFTVVNNIMYTADVQDKQSAIKNLTTEFTQKLDNLPNSERKQKQNNPLSLSVRLKNWLDGVDTKKDVFVFKGLDNQFYLYGKPTNFFKDREEEILKGTAHKEFINYLDQYPELAPPLWVWHEKDTEFKNKAIWWDYADGKVHFIWPLTPDEAEKTVEFLKEYDAGMSHGFTGERDPKTPQIFTSYFMEEVSILPKEFAANSLADFDLIEKRGNKNMAFSNEKRKVLSKFRTEEEIKEMEKNSEKQLKEALANGIHYKKSKKEEGEEVEETTTEETEVVETTTEETTTEEFTTEDELLKQPLTLADLQSYTDNLMQTIDAKFEALQKEIVKEKKSQNKNLSKQQIIAGMLAQRTPKSSIEDSKPVDENDSLLKQSPQETVQNGRTNLFSFSR